MANVKDLVIKGASKIDVADIKSKTDEMADIMLRKAGEAKDGAMDIKQDIEDKLTELDRMLKQSVTEYNDAYTIMNDRGVRLYNERDKSVETIIFVENVVNSIANSPKEFEKDFQEIETNRQKFVESCEFADIELQAARKASTSAGAGLAAGASVAFMAPTAAMWIATTFGTASTGAAISTLSGAAATNAAMAWLGGGAIASGGGGIAGGSALMALAGPIGWSIAGAALLSSILVFAAKRTKMNKEKNTEIEAVKENTERVKEMDAQIHSILEQTISIKSGVNNDFVQCLPLYNGDYLTFSEEEKNSLGSLVNNTKALAAMLDKVIEK